MIRTLETADSQYHDLVTKILRHGVNRPDRTGIGTRSIFGHVMSFDLSIGFPLITTKRVPYKLPLAELLWMLAGSGNARDLNKLGAHFWDKWAKENGDLGRVYGVQWRSWMKYKYELSTDGVTGVVVRFPYDQVAEAVRLLKTDPYSRRILVSAWNAGELDEMVLPPCPYSHQLYVENGRLSMIMNWRSVDVGIGMPFDIAVYGFLLHAYAKVAGLIPHKLICVSADTHIYLDHIPALEQQLKRDFYPTPQLDILGDHDDMDNFAMEDFVLTEFGSHPHIKMEAHV